MSIDAESPKWTGHDAIQGLCDLDQVGSPKPQVLSTQLTSPPALDMVGLIEAAHHHIGGTEAFIASAKKNPELLFQAMLKMGVALAAKESEALPDPHQLTQAQLEELSTDTLKRILLAGEGITTKDQLQSAKDQVLGT